MENKIINLIDDVKNKLFSYVKARADISEKEPNIRAPKIKGSKETNFYGNEVAVDLANKNSSAALHSKIGLFVRETKIFYKVGGDKAYIKHGDIYYQSQHGDMFLTLERIKNVLMAIDELYIIRQEAIDLLGKNIPIDVEDIIEDIQITLDNHLEDNGDISFNHGKTHASIRENQLHGGFLSSVLKRSVLQSEATRTFERCNDLLDEFKEKNNLKSVQANRSLGVLNPS